MVLTKIATGPRPDFRIFKSFAEEDQYFIDICGFCHNPDCNDDCVMPFPINGTECEMCDAGLVKFLAQPGDGGESYYVITKCGFCNGIGIV